MGHEEVRLAAGAPSAETAVDRVARAIIEGIRAGRYAPGQRLIEADLTRDLSVSRGPVREATRRLAAEGLLETMPHRGVAVRRLSRADVAAVYRVREVLEGLAARLAAERVRAAGPRVAASLRGGPACAPGADPAAYPDHNARFHAEIVRLADNPFLEAQIAALRLPLLRLQFRIVLNPETIGISSAGHRAVADAILAGDGTGADRAMRRHVRSSAKAIATLPDTIFGP